MAGSRPLIALDVAVLLPPDLSQWVIGLSAALPAEESQGLRLGSDRLPHVTLAQQFVREDALDAVLDRVGSVIRHHAPLSLTVTGSGRQHSTLSLVIEPTPTLAGLHARLMHALEVFEQEGSEAAFVDGDARPRDVDWVTGYRRTSSFGAFSPHVTLGHGDHPPDVEPFHFEAATIAACHLGRFCSCRRVIRSWTLSAAGSR